MRARCVMLLVLLLLAACSEPGGGGAALGPDALDPDRPAVAPVTAAPTTPVPATQPRATAPPVPTAPPRSDPTPARTPPSPHPAAAPTPQPLGEFDVALAPEISGVVASRPDPDLLWLLDDGPQTTSVVAVTTAGELITRVTMEGVEGRDTEAIAAGPCAADDPSPCLFVGDIGDNGALRDDVTVHRFPEPDRGATTTAVTSASYTHPGGPVDAEALLVGVDGIPVILTKEPDTTRVLAATAFADGALVEVGALAIPAPERPLLTVFTGLTVTAADVTADGQRVLLRTYDHVVELTAPAPGAPLSTLARWTPVELPVADEGQGEAIAYLADGRSYVTAAEGSGVLSVVRR